MLKDAPLTALSEPLVVLAGMGVVVLGLAMLRFRRDLAPSVRRGGVPAPELEPVSP